MNRKIIEEDLESIIHAEIPWNNLKSKTVLITGANGFIPSYIVETLLYLNEKLDFNISIVAYVRNFEKALKRFSNYSNRDDLNIVVQDICDPITYEDKIDYIIHAASQASPKYYKSDPVGTALPNIIGTKNLLEFAIKKNIESFLFISSGEVYGRQNNHVHLLIKENDYGYIDPMDISNCYAESKRMGENLCVGYFHQHKVPAKIVRPFHTYGPGLMLNDGRVFADFIKNIINNEDIVLTSDGSVRRPFCYISDVIIGFFTVILKGKNAEAYNVGFDKDISILELAELLINTFPEKNLSIIKKDFGNDNYLRTNIVRNCPNINKINNLGWHPVISIEEGFKRTIEYFEEII